MWSIRKKVVAATLVAISTIAAMAGSATPTQGQILDERPPPGDHDPTTGHFKTDNRLPTLTPMGNRAVGVGQNLQVALTADDPDGQSLVLTATSLPAFCTLNDAGDGTGSMDCTPSAGDVGNHRIRVRATDDGTPPMSDAQTLDLAVIDAGATESLAVVRINGDAPDTRSRNVTVTSWSLGPLTPTEVRIANGADPTEAAWQPFAPSIAWQLAGGAGPRMVSVQARYADGTVSPIVTDTIRHVPTGPSVTGVATNLRYTDYVDQMLAVETAGVVAVEFDITHADGDVETVSAVETTSGTFGWPIPAGLGSFRYTVRATSTDGTTRVAPDAGEYRATHTTSLTSKAATVTATMSSQAPGEAPIERQVTIRSDPDSPGRATMTLDQMVIAYDDDNVRFFDQSVGVYVNAGPAIAPQIGWVLTDFDLAAPSALQTVPGATVFDVQSGGSDTTGSDVELTGTVTVNDDGSIQASDLVATSVGSGHISSVTTWHEANGQQPGVFSNVPDERFVSMESYMAWLSNADPEANSLGEPIGRRSTAGSGLMSSGDGGAVSPECTAARAAERRALVQLFAAGVSFVYTMSKFFRVTPTGLVAALGLRLLGVSSGGALGATAGDYWAARDNRQQACGVGCFEPATRRLAPYLVYVGENECKNAFVHIAGWEAHGPADGVLHASPAEACEYQRLLHAPTATPRPVTAFGSDIWSAKKCDWDGAGIQFPAAGLAVAICPESSAKYLTTDNLAATRPGPGRQTPNLCESEFYKSQHSWRYSASHLLGFSRPG